MHISLKGEQEIDPQSRRPLSSKYDLQLMNGVETRVLSFLPDFRFQCVIYRNPAINRYTNNVIKSVYRTSVVVQCFVSY